MFTDVVVLLVLLGLPMLEVARHLDGTKRTALQATFVVALPAVVFSSMPRAR